MLALVSLNCVETLSASVLTPRCCAIAELRDSTEMARCVCATRRFAWTSEWIFWGMDSSAALLSMNRRATRVDG